MKSTDLILNTAAENKFAVWNGKKWIKFIVSGNLRYSKDKAREFWRVTSVETKKEVPLYRIKGQELFNEKKLILI